MKKAQQLTALLAAFAVGLTCLACAQTGSGSSQAPSQTTETPAEAASLSSAASTTEGASAAETTAAASNQEAAPEAETAATAETAPAAETAAAATKADTEQAAALAAGTAEQAPGIYLNGRALSFAEEGDTYLDLLTVEEGISIEAIPEEGQEIFVNGEAAEGTMKLDIHAITREDKIDFEIRKGENVTEHTVFLMPDTFKDYTVEGESATPGDYYLSTYDTETSYIFKLNGQGDLIFYKKTDNNALDFRKQYNSSGEIRYTYMLYKEGSFHGIQGINPGCVVILDENYDVIEEVYYRGSDGEKLTIDPHGFIYLDDGHYILTCYKDIVCDDIPEEIGAVDNSADLAVLYVQEIRDDEILWEFCSRDYPELYRATTQVNWEKSTDHCYDYVHFNSMYIDRDENLLMSCRSLDAILKLSRETGELMWILGGKEDMFGLTEEQKFYKQHSIILTEDGSYMMFNNGNKEVESGDAEFSSIIRLRVDEEKKEVTEFTKYYMNYYSSYMGSIRELDSQNRIYLYAVGGGEAEPQYSMIEYSEETGNLFTFVFDGGSKMLYCANKYE